MFGGVYQSIRSAGIKNSVRLAIADDFLDPFRRDATAAARPRVSFPQPRAGHVEFEIGILLLKLTKLFIEDDVRGRTDAVKNRDSGFQFPARSLARKAAEGSDAGTAGDANQMLVRLVNRQEPSSRRKDHDFITGLGPVHDARAHLAFTLDGDFEKSTVQRAGRKRIGAF